DNEISWVDWTLADTPEGRTLTAWVSRLGALRHAFPALQSYRFRHGAELAPGVPDITWYDERANPLTDEAWSNPEARALAVQRAGKGLEGKLDMVLMLVNGGPDPLRFALPAAHPAWYLLADSAEPARAAELVRDAGLEV